MVIEDDGPGIPEAVIGQVFEPFFRADPARRQNIPGAGLGMTIAHEIVTRAGGTIQIVNRPGGGLMQTVSMPEAPEPDEPGRKPRYGQCLSLVTNPADSRTAVSARWRRTNATSQFHHPAVTVALALLVSRPSLAEEQSVCADAQTTIEIGDCVRKAFDKADAELNDVWKQVMQTFKPNDYMAAKDLKTWKDMLTASQRAWVEFKEKDCESVSYEWWGGRALNAVMFCLLDHDEPDQGPQGTLLDR